MMTWSSAISNRAPRAGVRPRPVRLLVLVRRCVYVRCMRICVCLVCERARTEVPVACGLVHVRSLHRRHSAALGGDRRGVGPVYRCMRPARVPESATQYSDSKKECAAKPRKSH